MRMLTVFVYGMSAALILAGAVMYVFAGISFGGWLIGLTIAFTSIFQGWVIEKLFKQLQNKENQNKENQFNV